MTARFNPKSGLIIVKAELFGPSGSVILRLALDTGATSTMINVGPLEIVGYAPSISSDRLSVTTGGGIEEVSRISISRLNALGQERANFLILGHTLPPSAGVDGLLGLDFLRGREIRIDFRSGRIALSG